MKKLRMTAEELNALNPSYDNPVELVCDDGWFQGALDRVKVISPLIAGEVAAIKATGEICRLSVSWLKHYPSLKEEEKEEWETCREGINDASLMIYFHDGRYLIEEESTLIKSNNHYDFAPIQGGREFEVNFKTNEIRVKQ